MRACPLSGRRTRPRSGCPCPCRARAGAACGCWPRSRRRAASRCPSRRLVSAAAPRTRCRSRPRPSRGRGGGASGAEQAWWRPSCALAHFPGDVLALVADALALVGLGRALLADVGRDLADELLRDALHDDSCRLRHLELDADLGRDLRADAAAAPQALSRLGGDRHARLPTFRATYSPS